MPSLPPGTVTFLFTDIEGSTRLWEEHPDRMQRALARHDRLLGEAIERRGGRVVKSTGDGAYAVFGDPKGALEAALAAQRAMAAEDWSGTPIRVRMALHTGEAEERDGDYFGPALNRTARVLAAGYGGQILLTLPAYELAADTAPPGVEFMDLGSHRLRDVSAPEHLFQVVQPGLPTKFPRLRSLGLLVHNLPTQLTSFVGRTEELAEVEKLLEEKHHVTLVGPGGAGKTRLGVQVAGEHVENYPDGVWHVDLRQITDPAQVGSLIASTLRVVIAGERPVREQVVDALWWRQLLLVLDNCEQVLAETAWLVGELLQRDGGIRTLATTRQPLGIPGEAILRLDSLSLPTDPTHSDQLHASEAVRLFTDRALEVRPDFSVSHHATSVYEICRAVEGLPLAIELAAARLRVLSPEELADRLGDHLTVLRSSQRTGDLRHATMEATIDWSWKLLDRDEQTLFTRISSFPASFTLDAAEAICGFDPLNEHRVLDLITSLVDKSVVTLAEASADTTRYRMLEPVRQYAETKLDPHTTTHLQHRHVDYWTNTLPKANQLGDRHDQQLEQAADLEADQANITAAVEWAFDFERYEDAMRILGSRFGLLLQRRTQYELATGWMDRALEHRADISTPVLLDALAIAGPISGNAFRMEEWLRYSRLGEELSRTSNQRHWFQMTRAISLVMSGRHDEARPILDSVYQESDHPGFRASALIAKAQTERGEQGWALVEQAIELSPIDALSFWPESIASLFIGDVATACGRYDMAIEMLERARILGHASGWLAMEALAASGIAEVLALQGHLEQAAPVISGAIPVVQSILGPTHATTWAFLVAAQVSRLQGDFEQANDYAVQAAEAARRNDMPAHEIRASVQHALNSRDRGQLEEAARLLAEATQQAKQLGGFGHGVREFRLIQASVEVRGDRPMQAAGLLRQVLAESDKLRRDQLVQALDLAAITLTQTGGNAAAARLFGAVDAQREDLGLVISPPDVPIRQQALEQAKANLAGDWETELKAGRGLTLDQAVAGALAHLDN